MIINWISTKAQQLLPVHDAGLDELNLSFDFALSPEIMSLLYAQNVDGMDAGAVAEAGQQGEDVMMQLTLDEYELALA